MSRSSYVLRLDDSADSEKTVYHVEVPRGDRFDTPQFESVVSTTTTEWLWPERIPLGRVTVIEGGTRSGKSSVAFDFAARIAGRLPFPDGSPNPWPHSDVLVISRTDDAGRVAHRFQARGKGSPQLVRFTGF